MTSRVSFPTWNSTIFKLGKSAIQATGVNPRDFEIRLKSILKVLQNHSTHTGEKDAGLVPELAHQVLSKAHAETVEENTLPQLLKEIDGFCFGYNEFYTLFDTVANDHILVDPRVSSVLGIEPKDINLKALSGNDPENPLFHPSDLHHVVRSTLICYLVLTIPGFCWTAHSDFFRSRFRIGTTVSKFKSIRDLEYVMIEKRAYITTDQFTGPEFRPTQHFNRWSVYSAEEYQGVQGYFSCNPEQTQFSNLFYYLFQAFLLNLPPKYVLILDEKSRYDKNKEVANAINKRVQKQSGFDPGFDEVSIGDALAKTIRQKTTTLMDRIEKTTRYSKNPSDSASIQSAKLMGLLPMPEVVKDLLCSDLILSNPHTNV
jgi:hypothetical protein